MSKSVAASLLIALGDFALLKLGAPIGPVIFAFGLLGVCYMGLNLFTGKCGFWFQDHIKLSDLLLILLVNLVSGYVWGLLFSVTDHDVFKNAIAKVASWDFSMAFFLKSVWCGVIMYIAVLLYRKGTPLGIVYGIPLFIFCGFQHCIANIITMGAARLFHLSIVLCILGNFLGSILCYFFARDFFKKETALAKPQFCLEKIQQVGEEEKKDAMLLSSYHVLKNEDEGQKPSIVFLKLYFGNLAFEQVQDISFYSLLTGSKCYLPKKHSSVQDTYEFAMEYLLPLQLEGIARADYVHLLVRYFDDKRKPHEMLIGIIIKDEINGQAVLDYFCYPEGTTAWEKAISVYQENYQKIQKREQ